MRELFKRTVGTAVAMELVDLAVQAVDGSKVAANATRDRTYDAERGARLLNRLEKAIADLEAQNEAGEDTPAVHLPEELADKRALREQVRQAMDDLASQESLKHINLTDKDARLMKTRQGIVPSYNGQAMVSPVTAEGEVTGVLITAVGLVDEPDDHTSFTPMLEQAEETTGSKAPMTLADAGYYSGTNLEDCAGRGQAVAMPESSLRQSRDHPYHKDRFAYDESNDSFMCPQGKVLPFERIHIPPNGVRYRFYRAPGAVCRACPAFGVCTKSKDGRNVTVGPYDAALRRHRAWMTTSAATEVYKLRKQMVEPVFGIIKEQQAGRRFLLRGLINVAAEWTVLATAFNLRTLWRVWRSRIFDQVFGRSPCPSRGPRNLIALGESCR